MSSNNSQYIQNMLLLIALPVLLTFIHTSGYTKCPTRPVIAPKYYLVEKCYRSKIGVIIYANYSSLKSCQRLGAERNGLALNFNPPEARDNNINYTCEILKCAEVENGITLTNDTRYDYYSLYANPLPDVNTTCLPSIGMLYLITQKLNYTQAVTVCKNMSGVLADVTNEQRTDALAQLLAGAAIDTAFVGLRRNNSNFFNAESGGGLECSLYRAWAPGHPRRHIVEFNCVVITRSKTWQTTSCSKHYPSLCELLPGGPYKKGSIFSPKIINDTISTTNAN